jgi:hypothetical protein
MQTQDGEYALAGSTYNIGAGKWDAWVIKTDCYGNVLWSQTYGGVGEDQALSLIMASDGEFVVSGSTTTFGVGAWDAWLFKISSVNDLSGTQSPTQSPTPTSFSSNSPFASLVLISIGSTAFVVLSLAVYFKKRVR